MKRILAFLLCLSLFLAGCGTNHNEATETDTRPADPDNNSGIDSYGGGSESENTGGDWTPPML